MARPKKVKEAPVTSGSPAEIFFSQSGVHIAERFGEEVVSCAQDEDKNLRYLDVPDLGLQKNLGRRGFALGRILYVMGFEGASKTSFALWVANLAMQAGGIAGMVETEQASSYEHMKYYIDKPEMFRVYHPETIEQALSITIDNLNLFAKIDPEAKVPKVLILDSIGGSTDDRSVEDEENVMKQKVAGFSKTLKDATNLIKNKLKATNTLWVVLNQGRDFIDTEMGGMMRRPEIDKVVGTGGRAIPFAATYWAIIKRQAAVKEGGEKAGFKVKLTFKKNKLRNPLGETQYSVIFGNTIQFKDDTLDWLAKNEYLGIEKLKGGNYHSDFLGITKEEAVSGDELYDLIHSPEWIDKCREELDIITTDLPLVFHYEAPPKKEEDGTNTESNAGAGEEAPSEESVS